jgi:hypothetical protein
LPSSISSCGMPGDELRTDRLLNLARPTLLAIADEVIE